MSVLSPQVLHTTNDKKGNGPRYAPARLVAVLTVILVGAYALPLYQLARYSLENQLWSHVLLVPWVSVYLVCLRNREIPAASSSFSVYAAIPLVLGIAVISSYCVVTLRGAD